MLRIPNNKLFIAVFTLVLSAVLCGAYWVSAKHKAPANLKGKKLEGLSMEDGFKKVPDTIAAALDKDGGTGEYKTEGCREFVGRKVSVTNTKNASVWVVTTPGCGWGAHTAPIWLLLSEQGRYSVILSTSGIALDVYSARGHGLRDIVISDGSAGYYAEEHFRFDGRKYHSIESKMVVASDPDACRKAPGVFECN